MLKKNFQGKVYFFNESIYCQAKPYINFPWSVPLTENKTNIKAS